MVMISFNRLVFILNVATRSNIVLIFIGFMTGGFLGYLFSHWMIHNKLTADILGQLFKINSYSLEPWNMNIQANPAFLSDIAAIEAAIIAFLVPLSIEIISKLSERYNSDVITRAFARKWENRLLTPFLLINIILAVIMRFLIKDDTDTICWAFLSWIILIAFMFVAFLIWRVINHIKNFMTEERSVLNQLYEDVEKSIQ